MRLLAFGIAREIMGSGEVTVGHAHPQTVGGLKDLLIRTYPSLAHLHSLRIAVNGVYVDDGHVVQATDEVAVIPPVSGG
jgi:molybdopterin synthase sulfur carrier subunit